MATVKQIGSLLEKSFEKWDFKKAIRLSDNESKTREYFLYSIKYNLGHGCPY